MGKAVIRKSVQELYRKALNAFLIRDYQLTVNLLQEQMSRVKPDIPLLLLYGNALSRLKMYPEAEGAYTRALKQDPNNSEILNNLGILYKENNRTDEAEKCLRKAIQHSPNRADIYYNLGNIFKQKNEPDTAELYFRKAIETDRKFIPPYNNLGSIYKQQGEDEKALTVYTRGLKMDPKNYRLNYNRGLIYQERKEWEKAKEAYTESLKSRPGYLPCLNNLGIVLQQLEEYGRADAAFDNILKKDPQNIAALNNRGVLSTKMGEPDKAREYLRQAVKADPSYKKAVFNLNDTSEEEEKSDEEKRAELDLLNKLSTKYPMDLNIQARIGETLASLDRLHDSEESLNRVLQRDPNQERALRAIVQVYAKTGRMDMLSAAFERMRNTQTENKDFQLKLARTLAKLNHFEQAESILKGIIEKNPEFSEAKRLLAQILKYQNRLDESLSVYRGLESSQEDLIEMAEAYSRKGDKAGALQILDQAISGQHTDGIVEDLDKFQETLQLYESAANAFRENNGDLWAKNLIRLKELTKPEEPVIPDDPFAFLDMPMEEADAINLLDINAMDPIIRINEEEETIYIEDGDESILENYKKLYDDDEMIHGMPSPQGPSAGDQGYHPPQRDSLDEPFIQTRPEYKSPPPQPERETPATSREAPPLPQQPPYTPPPAYSPPPSSPPAGQSAPPQMPAMPQMPPQQIPMPIYIPVPQPMPSPVSPPPEALSPAPESREEPVIKEPELSEKEIPEEEIPEEEEIFLEEDFSELEEEELPDEEESSEETPEESQEDSDEAVEEETEDDSLEELGEAEDESEEEAEATEEPEAYEEEITEIFPEEESPEEEENDNRDQLVLEMVLPIKIFDGSEEPESLEEEEAPTDMEEVSESEEIGSGKDLSEPDSLEEVIEDEAEEAEPEEPELSFSLEEEDIFFEEPEAEKAAPEDNLEKEQEEIPEEISEEEPELEESGESEELIDPDNSDILSADSGEKEDEEPLVIEEPLPPAAQPVKEQAQESCGKKSDIDKKSVADLLGYLKGLSQEIEEDKKRILIENEIPVKMEVLRSKLTEGDKSLRQAARVFDRRDAEKSRLAKIEKEQLAKTMDFFSALVEQNMGDKDLSESLNSRLSKIKNAVSKPEE